jgi:hypothetical protein
MFMRVFMSNMKHNLLALAVEAVPTAAGAGINAGDERGA